MPVSEKNANIYQVAELANVSAMTVARAFSGKAPVAERTRMRILEAAKQIGYRPNLLARGLRGGSTKTIGLLWSLCPPHSSIGQVRDISSRLMKHHYACQVVDSLSDPAIIRHSIGDFVDRRVDGVIFGDLMNMDYDRELIELLKRLPAVLLVVKKHCPELPFDQLVMDEDKSIADIAEHFIRTGRKHLLFLHSSGHESKVNAFRTVLKKYALPCGAGCASDISKRIDWNGAKFNWQVYPACFADQEERYGKYDGVICSTDEGAAVLMKKLLKDGRKVPEDIAVCGFNNSYMSEFFTPPIASVRRMESETAELIEQMILARLEDRAMKKQWKTIHMEFVHRESAG